MSMPIPSIAIMASGLTRVASVPAENASKQSPDKCLSSPSAIWLLAELWVHRNRTLLFFCGASAAATGHAPLFGAGEQAIGGLAEQRPGDLPVERVEGPLPAPLLAHQPRVLELLHVVGDLRLAHAEDLLKLADAYALFAFVGGDAGDGEIAAAAAVGHHGEHPHPYGVAEGAAQGHDLVYPLLGGAPADADAPRSLSGHHGRGRERWACLFRGGGPQRRRSTRCRCSWTITGGSTDGPPRRSRTPTGRTRRSRTSTG